MDNYSQQHKASQSIADYLAGGSKTYSHRSLGLELEHFVVRRGSLDPVFFLAEAKTDAPSVLAVLQHLQPYYPEAVLSDSKPNQGLLIGLRREQAAISLEPGGQLEISIGPCASITQIQSQYELFRSQIDPVLESLGLQLLERGYHPTSLARDIPLLPKQRYQFMDAYFRNTGQHGINMMRATASTQVSIDYFSEADAIQKYRLANALGPLFAFITDNSPVFERKPVAALTSTGARAGNDCAVPQRMARMTCWDDTDPWRCLSPKACFDVDFSFLRYATSLLESPGIFLPAGTQTSEPTRIGFSTFAEVLPDEPIAEALILHILSLFFFDVRFKDYIEIRQADSMPLAYALAYTALISGLFYRQQTLDYLSAGLSGVDTTTIALAKSALRAEAYNAEVYDRPAVEWLDELVELASTGLSRDDAAFLEPLIDLIGKRQTLLELRLD